MAEIRLKYPKLSQSFSKKTQNRRLGPVLAPSELYKWRCRSVLSVGHSVSLSVSLCSYRMLKNLPKIV